MSVPLPAESRRIESVFAASSSGLQILRPAETNRVPPSAAIRSTARVIVFCMLNGLRTDLNQYIPVALADQREALLTLQRSLAAPGSLIYPWGWERPAGFASPLMSPQELLRKMAGVFAPISTPFRDDEEVDYDALKFNLERYAASGLLGFLALGSNGENRSLTEEERLQVLDTIVKHKGRGQVVMACATYDAQRDTEQFLARRPALARTSAWSCPPAISASR